MAVHASRRLVLQWTFRGTPCRLISGLNVGNLDKQQTVSIYRNLCSRNDKHATEHATGPCRVEMLSSLVDLGFTESQAEQLARGTSDGRAGHAATQHLSTLSALVALGLNPSSVLKVVEKCPELLRVKEAQLQQRVDNLRKLGLVEGSLQRVVSHYPQLLTLPRKRVISVSRFLREKCLFTGQQVTEILRDTPAIVQEDMSQLEYKFQYAYFRMGIRQPEMLKAGLFRVSLEEVRCRHAFLERRGLYQTPDKKGQTRIANPKLKDFLAVPEDAFLSQVALATQEEFEVFRKLTAREMLEEEEDELESGDEDDDDDEDSEEGYESEGRGSVGYRKRKK
ncbi:hypothetical protein MATL_G00242770 [Megalops atlanticus]|uniref:Mitochondrial transcription termination factor 4 n=1 Tax=Megalops atlanticus TaxID=7932 RepID=A0A9D3PCK0_MEGAT|nr:hypothetical protein MATL_G00242770 [Megalops atlanticus]